ncbi:P-loop NTPase family protein [Desulfogranum japonicum]|uniref:hypothetical protein n=1 Tax=Desulfogranum japonicum TaxID=231447 RepID=UPI0003FA2C4C|nr:hypothetical protein [Desulfogranum japonicum]
MITGEITQYLNKQTLLTGDVNSGKSTKTAAILEQFLAAGYGPDIAILDLAPDPVQGIGGKLSSGTAPPVLYLTGRIAAPRLMGRDATHTLDLARQNAHTIEKLFAELQQHSRDILFINDATLYLQAGNYDLFLDILQSSSTRIINAYYGNAFDDSELTRRERQLTERLMANSERVIQL